jgi:hypothetical protein
MPMDPDALYTCERLHAALEMAYTLVQRAEAAQEQARGNALRAEAVCYAWRDRRSTHPVLDVSVTAPLARLRRVTPLVPSLPSAPRRPAFLKTRQGVSSGFRNGVRRGRPDPPIPHSTVIPLDGHACSGGHRQGLGVGRALLKNCAVSEHYFRTAALGLHDTDAHLLEALIQDVDLFADTSPLLRLTCRWTILHVRPLPHRPLQRCSPYHGNAPCDDPNPVFVSAHSIAHTRRGVPSTQRTRWSGIGAPCSIGAHWRGERDSARRDGGAFTARATAYNVVTLLTAAAALPAPPARASRRCRRA